MGFEGRKEGRKKKVKQVSFFIVRVPSFEGGQLMDIFAEEKLAIKGSLEFGNYHRWIEAWRETQNNNQKREVYL